MVVRTDGSVALRRGELTATSGLVIVAECALCDHRASGRHVHRRWRMRTTSGYLVGDMSLPSRTEAQAAAVALGELPIDWQDPVLAVQFDPEQRSVALATLARWGLARAAA
jgi:hypothetical protein